MTTPTARKEPIGSIEPIDSQNPVVSPVNPEPLGQKQPESNQIGPVNLGRTKPIGSNTPLIRENPENTWIKPGKPLSTNPESSGKSDLFLRENNRWLTGQLRQARTFSPFLKRFHNWAIGRKLGYKYANTRVRKAVDGLKVADLHFAADDQEIRDLSESFAKRYGRNVLKSTFDIERMKANFEDQYAFSLPKETNAARISCSKFWRRQLRKISYQRVEQLARELGYTRKGVAPYVSDWGFKAWLVKDQRNRKLLEETEAENQFGDIYTLAQLSDLGISNPVNKRNELMVRMDGFEDYAEKQIEQHWVAVFYTWTTPSKYHPTSMGKPNPKYKGATPLEAQSWLNGQWQKARSSLNRDGIPFFGFRVAEPHHDGTPHWHMLFFVPKGRRKALTAILKRYVMAENSREPGARKHRFKAELIDPRKGRATAYLAKYISKNIDGHGLEIDEEAEDYSAISALRVRAWASIWNIRQFQQIGGPSVTVYRESRKAANNYENLISAPTEETKEIIQAADDANWCDFTVKMGGAVCKRALRPLQLAYFVKEKLGQYGDKLKKVFGLWSNYQPKAIAYPLMEWTISHKNSGAGLASEAVAFQAPSARTLEFCQ